MAVVIPASSPPSLYDHLLRFTGLGCTFPPPKRLLQARHCKPASLPLENKWSLRQTSTPGPSFKLFPYSCFLVMLTFCRRSVEGEQ